MMHRSRTSRNGIAWLELLLILAAIVLLLQLFPSFGVATLWALDPRNWPRTVWFAVNVVVVLALMVIRVGPDLYDDWKERRETRARNRRKEQKQNELREQHETFERMKDAQKRRIY